MKKVIPVLSFSLLFVFLFGVLGVVNGQELQKENNYKGQKQFLDDFSKPAPKALDKKTSQWSQKKKRVKGVDSQDQPDMFVKFHNEIRTAKGKNQPDYEAAYQVKEYEKAIQTGNRLGKTENLNWIERGPGNVGGRTRAIIIDPNDATHKTWIAGAVSGGIWQTTNAGETWTEIAPNMPNPAVTTLAMPKSNNRVIYAGTGEGFYNSDATNGNGIFKTTDRGATWTHLTSTVGNLDFQNINRIIVDPNNENVVLVCYNNSFWLSASDRSSGIHKSINGGRTWTKVYSSSNRVQQLVADPENFNIVYATEEGVGVLKSIDGGNTWTTKSTGITTGARFELAISPNNSNLLYLAAESSPSTLFYSTDAANTWTRITDPVNGDGVINWLGAQGWYDNTLAVHPFDDNTVYLGGINIWKATLAEGTTIDAGITSVEENGTEAFMDFTNWGGGYLRGGLDLGANFFGAVDLEDDDYVSVEIRFGPGKSQKAYRFQYTAASYFTYREYIDVPFEVWDITNNRQISVSFRDHANNGVYNLGAYGSSSWREYVFVNVVPYSETPDANIAQDQGLYYKNLYAYWPHLRAGATWDPDNLPESNLRITWEETLLQNAEFTRLTNWYAGQAHPEGGVYPYVHADHHAMEIKVTSYKNQSFRIVNGNDGGVEYSDDGGTTWNKTLNGYVTTQFYGVDKKPGANEYIGGMQDNGTWRSESGVDANSLTDYSMELGGDGYETSWKYDDGNQIIGTLYSTRPYKTTNGGQSWTVANNGLGDYDQGSFITSIAKTNSDPDLVFTTGPTGVWRSDNFADSWTLSELSDPTQWSYQGTKTNVAISQADPQVVWAGSYLDAARKVFVSVDGGLTFEPVELADNVQGRITQIETHPTEPNTAFLIFSFAKSPKIIKTTDLGQTWTDITGFEDGQVSTNGFPDVAVYSLLVMPYNTDIMWAGTEIGLFETLDGGTTWAIVNNGFPAVPVWKMKVVDDQIVVGTHGRGIWTVTLPELATYQPPVVVKSPRLDVLAQAPTGELAVVYTLRSVYDSTNVYVDGVAAAKIGINQVGSFTTGIPVTEEATVTVELISYKDGKAYKSTSLSADVLVLNEPQETYANDFNAETTDFSGVGFEVAEVEGFSNGAIHTEHPYSSNLNIIDNLLIPIEISSADATLRYKDIALVEPGDAGGFWDYVVVEGTKDGINWIPLIDEYDCNLYQDWLDAYSAGTAPDSSLFKSHEIALGDFFSVGDIVLFRFRLFADGNTEGWGWVIDDVRIDQTVTGVEETNGLPTSYSISQNYPNPFNPMTSIKFALPNRAIVKLAVYDAIGQQVASLINEEMEAGYHSIMWNGTNVSSGVYFYRIEAGDFVQTKKMILLK